MYVYNLPRTWNPNWTTRIRTRTETRNGMNQFGLEHPKQTNP